MKKTVINPWQWQNNFGYAQAIEVKSNTGTLYCSGQAAINADGKPVTGDMSEQIKCSLDNLHHVIKHADYNTSNIVRLNFYTTSVSSFFEAYGTIINWMNQQGCTPSSTLVEVASLAFPELNIEIEATVVK